MVSNKLKSLLVAVLFFAGAFVLLAAKQGPAVYAASNDTITLTSPNNTTMGESDDYATQVLGDPWDMNNLEDLDTPFDYSNMQVSNGIWSGTTTAATGGSVMLQYQNYNNSYSYVGEKDGRNNPVDPNRFSRLWVRMNASGAGNSILFWFRHLTFTAAGNSPFFQVQPGWHIYSIDLHATGGGATGSWATGGPYEGLRLDAPWNVNNDHVQYDWVRLTPNTGQAVNITWNYSGAGSGGVNLYLSTSSDPSSDNEYLIANVAASAHSYSWNITGVAPGRYYIHAAMNGAVSSSGPLNVNTSPLARIDAPSTLSGEDFAQAQLNTTWNGTNCGQFELVAHVSGLTCAPGVVQGAPATNDPQLIWLNHDTAHHIDASRYVYMNIRFKVWPPAVRPWSPFNAGTRMTWDSGAGVQQTYLIIAPYNVWIPSAWDLRHVPLVQGSQGWASMPYTLRFDVLEQDEAYGQPSALPALFQVDNSHLMSQPLSGPGTLIRWTPLQGSGTVDLYWDHDNSGYNGTLIASGVPLSKGWYGWNTSGLANGNYFVYIVAHDGYNSSHFYSLVPLVVDHNSKSTIFTDVPTNHWAADYINKLALQGIVVGTTQADTTITFSPNSNAPRAYLTRMVVLAAGWQLQNPSSATFADVPVGSTYFQYVETAYAHSVVVGYPCGGAGEPCDSQNRRYFRPNSDVTRAQTTKLISLSMGWPLSRPSNATFSDVPVSDSMFPYVETVYAHGLITGYPCGGVGEPCNSGHQPYFRSGNSVTRAQLSKMLSNAMGTAGPSK